jgi:hypothetical protein
MAARKLPDIDFVREALSYDPDTGIFTWRERPAHHFPDAKTWNPRTWNARFAGKRAGSINQAGPRRIFWEIPLGIPGTFKAHRLAWLLVYGEPVPELIDHINADSTDNRIVNLRAADKSGNGMNQRVSTRNKSGIKGVFKHAKRYPKTPFMAYITVKGRRHHLGYFATAEEAIEARRKAAIELHGEFHRHE